MNFHAQLIKELLSASKNNFSHQENYDQFRFGKIEEAPLTFKGRVKQKLIKAVESRGYAIAVKQQVSNQSITERLELLDPFLEKLETFYSLLSEETSKTLLIQILAFRILGFTKVKLPLNTPDYWVGIKEIEDIADKTDYVSIKFMNWHLPLIDLNKKGIPVRLHFLPQAAYIDFIVKQYVFTDGSTTVKAQKGDVVIDAGGCWGDTALYFAEEIGESGKVFVFEFIPSNLAILKKNLSLNPDLKQRINLVSKPVWEKSNEIMYYVDNGPGSKVFMDEQEVHDGKASSLSIDDLVLENSLPKVDFIKMDIEGAEPYALKGAVETIKKFKPKLAIANYHSLEDFVNIPAFIHSLGLGYQLHLGHYSIHEEESILFAEVPS